MLFLFSRKNVNNELNMSQTEIRINIPEDKVLSLSTSKKSKWLFPFTPVGKISMKNPNTLDALDIICKFNVGQLFLLKIIKDNIDKTNEVTISKSGMSLAVQRKVTSAMQSFIKMNLAVRIKREHYLINPYFLIPYVDYHQVILDKWEELNQKEA